MKQKFLTLVTAFALVASGAVARAADTVKIGLMAPLTGSWASEGQGMKKIVELLAEQLLAEQQNAKGGVLGKQIEVVVEDDGGDPRTASLAAQRLTTRGVAAVVGTYGSSVTEASQAIYASQPSHLRRSQDSPNRQRFYRHPLDRKRLRAFLPHRAARRRAGTHGGADH